LIDNGGFANGTGDDDDLGLGVADQGWADELLDGSNSILKDVSARIRRMGKLWFLSYSHLCCW
jgi:hypothetical protein